MCSVAGKASVLITIAITVKITPVETKVATITVEVPTIVDKVPAVIRPVIPEISAIMTDVHPVMMNVAAIIKTALGLSAYGEEKAGGDEYGQFGVHTSKF